MDKRKVLEDVIAALLEYYGEYGEEKSMEYMYGFMDAMGAVRDMLSASAPVRNTGHPL